MTTPHLTRRRLLQATSGAAVGLAGAGTPAYAAGSEAMRPDGAVVPFHGAYQAGATTSRRRGCTAALNEYIEPRSCAVFAIPAGVARGGYVAQGLLA